MALPLNALIADINAQPDVHAMVRSVTELATDALGLCMAALYLVRSDGSGLDVTISHCSHDCLLSTYVPLRPDALERVLDEWAVPAERRAANCARPVLAVPLKAGQRIIGRLVMMTERETRFDVEEERLARLFASRAARALQNRRLYEEVRRYPTGLERRVTTC